LPAICAKAALSYYGEEKLEGIETSEVDWADLIWGDAAEELFERKRSQL